MMVVVHGLGRIGLPLAVALAEVGHRVRGVDLDPAVRAAVRDGRAPFAEPGLDPRLAAAVRRGRLAVGDSGPADVHIVAVPTGLCASGREPDLTAVHRAVDALTPDLRDGDLLVLESTCPPGTTDGLAASLRARIPGLSVACATERALPGRVLEELCSVPRVIGAVDRPSGARAAALYAALGCSVEVVAPRVAEVVKLVENAYRHVNVAFANEVDMVCAALGVDARHVLALANAHPRVQVLAPGPGAGGACLPMASTLLLHGLPSGGTLMRTALDVDARRVAWSVDRIRRCAGEGRVVCLGVTYKADTDDLRGSASLAVARQVQEAMPGRVRIVDPWVAGRMDGVDARVEDAVAEATLVVALVAHTVFRALPSTLWEGKELLDLCGLWALTSGAG